VTPPSGKKWKSGWFIFSGEDILPGSLVLSPIINIVFYRQGAKVAKNIIIDFTEASWRS
jgi:hypothetical protein